MDKTNGAYPIGAIITVFKIGPVLTDTINSVLAQRDIALNSVVVVVDGCGYTQTTRDICNRYARARPGLVHFVWLENGGVSKARNTGVKWTLQHHPDTQGVFLIDGDDLVDPLFVSRCIVEMRAAQQRLPERNVGWTYSNQGQFGDDSPFTEYPRDFIPTRWLSNNLSQPSCLIDRKMFDAGVYWDEDMRRGIEDWEYWLSAIEAGFAGTPSGNTYLRYRRLTGNRSSLNRINDVLTKEYMRKKHKSLYSVEQYMADESVYFPRWALLSADTDYSFELCTDPTDARKSVERTEFLNILSNRFSQRGVAPCIVHPYFPDMIAFVDAQDAKLLQSQKRYFSTLLHIERLLDNQGLITFSVDEVVGRTAEDNEVAPNTTRQVQGRPDTPFTSFFMSVRKVVEMCRSLKYNATAADLVSHVLEEGHQHVQLAADLSATPASAKKPFDRAAQYRLEQIVSDFHAVAALPKSTSHLHRDRHTTCGINCANHKELCSTVVGIWPLLPRMPNEEKIRIGVLAREADITSLTVALDGLSLRDDASRFDINLVFVGSIAQLQQFASHPLVGSIAVVNGVIEPNVPGSKGGYLGLPHYERMEADTRDHLVGLLAGSSMLLDFCGPEMSAVIFDMKAMGCECVLIVGDRVASPTERHDPMFSECVVDTDSVISSLVDRQTDPVAVQAYGGAYRYFLTDDTAVQTRLSSYGVPSSRFVSNYQDILPSEDTVAVCDVTSGSTP